MDVTWRTSQTTASIINEISIKNQSNIRIRDHSGQCVIFDFSVGLWDPKLIGYKWRQFAAVLTIASRYSWQNAHAIITIITGGHRQFYRQNRLKWFNWNIGMQASNSERTRQTKCVCVCACVVEIFLCDGGWGELLAVVYLSISWSLHKLTFLMWVENPFRSDFQKRTHLQWGVKLTSVWLSWVLPWPCPSLAVSDPAFPSASWLWRLSNAQRQSYIYHHKHTDSFKCSVNLVLMILS